MGGFNTSVAQPSPVALDLKPPESQSPMQIAAQLQQLRSGQLQIQGQRIEQQKAQMDLAQRKAINDAYQQAFTPQPDGSVQLDDTKLTGALATAGHGEAIPGIMENLTKYRQSLASLQETNQKVTAAEADAAGNLGATVKAANNDPTLFHSLLTDAINRKIIQPSHYAPIDQQLQASLQQDPTGEQARSLVGQFTDQMIAGSPKQQELATAKTAATARVTAAETGQTKETREAGQQAFTNAVSDLGANPPQSAAEYEARLGKLSPAVATRILTTVPVSQYDPAKSGAVIQKLGMNPDQQATVAQAAANAAQTAAHNKVEEGQGAQRIGIERENSARMQRQFDATYGALLGPNGEQLSPEAQKSMAQQDPMAVAVANYQLPPPAASRGGQGAMVLRKVMAINPAYNAQNWQAQAGMMKGYTAGSQSKEIGGINTALGHVGQLADAVDALHNNDTQALNRIANFYQVQTGGTAATTFGAIVHKVAPEINRAYVGGVGAQGEVLAQESDFDSKMSPQQLNSNVGTTVKLLRSKIGSLENQWKQTMGTDFAGRFITPEAAGVVNRFAPQSALQSPSTGGGAGGRGAAKTVSSALVHQYAVEHRIDDATAKTVFTGNGYTVQ
jgi:hypothetical protein